jgi:hypothetical protein
MTSFSRCGILFYPLFHLGLSLLICTFLIDLPYYFFHKMYGLIYPVCFYLDWRYHSLPKHYLHSSNNYFAFFCFIIFSNLLKNISFLTPLLLGSACIPTIVNLPVSIANSTPAISPSFSIFSSFTFSWLIILGLWFLFSSFAYSFSIAYSFPLHSLLILICWMLFSLSFS